MKITFQNFREKFSEIKDLLSTETIKDFNDSKESGFDEFYGEDETITTALDNLIAEMNQAVEKHEKSKKDEPKQEKEQKPNHHGYKIGDKVLYRGKIFEIKDLVERGAVIDTMENGIMLEVVYWDEIQPYKETQNKKLPEPKAKKEPKAKTKPKPKKEPKQKQKKAKAKKEKPTYTGDYSNDIEIKFLSQAVALQDKAFSKTNKNKCYAILKGLQKAIVNRQIRKTSEFADEIRSLQDALVKACNTRADETSAISFKSYDKYVKAIEGNRFTSAISLLRRGVELVNSNAKSVKDKAKAIIKAIEKLSDKERQGYSAELKEMDKALQAYVDGKTDYIEVSSQTLNGLCGLCGVSFDAPQKGQIVNSMALAGVRYDILKFDGKWHNLIGDPQRNFKMMIYGKPGHGKSTFALNFAGYLSRDKKLKVLYIASEEGTSYVLKEKLQRLGVMNSNLSIVDEFPNSAELKKFDVIFIDSVNHAELTPEFLNKLPHNLSYVYVFQTTKDGKFRGVNTFLHDVDVSIKIEDMVAVPEKNRFGASGIMEVNTSLSYYED